MAKIEPDDLMKKRVRQYLTNDNFKGVEFRNQDKRYQEFIVSVINIVKRKVKNFRRRRRKILINFQTWVKRTKGTENTNQHH